jgi:hypothetical protein
MKRFIHPALALLGVLFGVVAFLYLRDIHDGFIKHTPPCAPIRRSTVLIVFAFTAIGAGISVLGFLAARRRMLWFPVVLVAVFLNVAAFSTWGYWVGNKTLLPYDDWCRKVGMP